MKKISSSSLKRQETHSASDICGIGKFVKKKFLTWAEWEKYNWPEQYKHTDFDVDVSFRIRRTGLIIKSAHW
ncbi:MAG: Ger(x)C family spore germination C-terminal domain-containing protein [Acetivibrionales bacterium]